MAVRILVLEDDPDMRAALAEVLQDEGYQVVAVERGADAIECARQDPFDLIVSDIRMEGMSGLDAIEELKREQPELGALVVSGWASEEETLRAVRLNVGGYLKKPFAMDEFLQMVQELVQRSLSARRSADQRDALDRALVWGISTVSKAVDRNLEFAARLATRLGRAAGMAEAAAAQAGLLALILQLKQLPVFALPTWLEQEQTRLPWLGPLRQPDSALHRLAALAVQLAEQSEGEFELLPAPESLPASVPDSLRQAYAQLLTQDWETEAAEPGPEVKQGLQDPSRVGRSLLNLATTLEQAGDLQSARAAYAQVADGELSRESVQAGLGLAHLAWRQRDLKAVTHWTEQVVAQSAHLGPVAYANALFECGLLQYRVDPAQARAALEQAAQAQHRVGLRGGQAQSCLLLSKLGSENARAWLPQALEILNDPVSQAEFSHAWSWLLPVLLELGSEPALSSCQVQLYRPVLSQSRQLLQALRGHQVSAPARLAFLRALESSQKPLPADVLDWLQQDADAEVRALAVRLRGREQVGPSVPVLRLHTLGFFEVLSGDQRLSEAHWKTQKTRYLLAFLVSHVGRLVAEDQVLEEFWPDDVVRGKRNLYAAISIVRRLLRPAVQDGVDYDYVVRDRDMLGFNWSLPHYCDLEQLELALAQAQRSGEAEESLSALRRVAQLYTAPYLDGSYLEWVVRRREDLEERTLRALCRLASLLCQQRAYHEALEHSTRAVALAPHAQEAHLLKMRSLLGLNQPEAVLKQFAQCEKMLRQEYGIEPNTELIEVSLRARHGLPDLAQ